jgi:hypothetical protein
MEQVYQPASKNGARLPSVAGLRNRSSKLQQLWIARRRLAPAMRPRLTAAVAVTRQKTDEPASGGHHNEHYQLWHRLNSYRGVF